MLQFIIDKKNPNSLSAKSRRKRFDFFMQKLDQLGRPIKILDVGGTQQFWKHMDFVGVEGVQIYLLNLEHQQIKFSNFISLKGDATDLSDFEDNYFDMVFSNSVIEHLFTWKNQMKMATEIARVGKNYFIQTPNYWFPIEPHFVFPFFHYLPKGLRVELISRFPLGHHQRYLDRDVAKERVEEVKLLSIGEMKRLFPGSKIYLDKFLILNKSIVAYKMN